MTQQRTFLSPRASAELKLKAEAEKDRRQRAGVWGGSIVAHTEYQRRPLEWIVEKLGVPEHTLRWSLNPGYQSHEWDGTRDPIVAIFDAVAGWHDCGVESGTGLGKTVAAALLTLWFIATHENSLVITSAPKAENLLNQVWREIGSYWPTFSRLFPAAELLTGKIRMRPGEGEKEMWTAMAFVAGVGADEEAAQKAAGFHRKDMLIITEDTPGIDGAIMTAFNHTRTDDHNLHLALGNPDHRDDSLHRFCFDQEEQLRPNIVHVRISALDHPNIVTGESVIPGAIGARRLQERTAEYGGQGERLYESRVRGICPAQAEDSLIKEEWCVAASKKWDDPAYRQGLLALGADVADNPSGDKAAIALWQGACCVEVNSFAVQENALDVADRLFVAAHDKENPVEPKHIGIDGVGVGASVVNDLRRRGLKVRSLIGSVKAVARIDTDVRWGSSRRDEDGALRPAGPAVVETEQFDRFRSQVWWQFRKDLMFGRIALPVDPGLWKDLCTPRYTTRNGKLCVEPKEEIKKRLGRSPDKGDACVYGNWVRRRTPVEAGVRVPGVKPTANVDIGLERYITRHKRKQQADQKRIDRMLARRARLRKGP